MREIYLSKAKFVFLFLFYLGSLSLYGQEAVLQDYGDRKDYEIGNIKVTGAEYSDENAIISITGLRVGNTISIPGDEITKAIKSLWKLRLFTDIQILKEKEIGDVIFLEIKVVELPNMSNYTFSGTKKTFNEDLGEEVTNHIIRGSIVTDNNKNAASNAIKDFFVDKGFLDTEVSVTETKDTLRANGVILNFNIDTKKKVKIRKIEFVGTESLSQKKLRKQMDTKEKRRFLASSKLIKKDFKNDKIAIAEFANNQGFRDFSVTSDSIYRNDNNEVMIQINVDEGRKYYFRNITWKGNSIYTDDQLTQQIKISKGDTYDAELLDGRLHSSEDNSDISSLYLDNGYLFFRIDPVETSIQNDSIDIEMRIYEGPLATIDKVIIEGNDRTHEHVIRKEIRTKPGQKFSRNDIIRSVRQIINLGYFNPETLQPQPIPNDQKGTVDIKYAVEEQPSDQLELSAGFGGFSTGVIGTLGVTFNNFSIRNIFNREAWNPLPQGDGQRLSLRAQTNGSFYQSYNMSFTEPWLGGKKPTSFTAALVYTGLTNGVQRGTSTFQELSILNGSLGLGTQLKWPDDNFIGSATVNIQTITLQNWQRADFVLNDGTFVTNGKFYNFSINFRLARNTVLNPYFPQQGSKFDLSVQLTPPYSGLGITNPNKAENLQERFEYLEYHKWKFDIEWYAPLTNKFVLKAAMKFGMLGFYNKNIGTSPFEKFQLGGDGISNRNSGLLGYDLISLRGYDEEDIPSSDIGGAAVFDKFTIELRYPFSTNPSSTIYAYLFAQGGNSWNRIRDFNPFEIKRSAGVGVRVFLPMFGILGFDYGFGFDKPELIANGSKWSEFATFNVVLGFEPE